MYTQKSSKRWFFTFYSLLGSKNCSRGELFEKLKAKHETSVIFCKNDELIQLNDWVNEQSCLAPQKWEKLNSISKPNLRSKPSIKQQKQTTKQK